MEEVCRLVSEGKLVTDPELLNRIRRDQRPCNRRFSTSTALSNGRLILYVRPATRIEIRSRRLSRVEQSELGVSVHHLDVFVALIRRSTGQFPTCTARERHGVLVAFCPLRGRVRPCRGTPLPFLAGGDASCMWGACELDDYSRLRVRGAIQSRSNEMIVTGNQVVIRLSMYIRSGTSRLRAESDDARSALPPVVCRWLAQCRSGDDAATVICPP